MGTPDSRHGAETNRYDADLKSVTHSNKLDSTHPHMYERLRFFSRVAPT